MLCVVTAYLVRGRKLCAYDIPHLSASPNPVGALRLHFRGSYDQNCGEADSLRPRHIPSANRVTR